MAAADLAAAISSAFSRCGIPGNDRDALFLDEWHDTGLEAGIYDVRRVSG